MKQIGVNAANEMVLVITRKEDGAEYTISWSRVKKIGEVVLLQSEKEAAVDSHAASAQATSADNDNNVQAQSQNPNMCKSCAFENGQGSKFCEECGTKMP